MPWSSLLATSLPLWTTVEACRAMGPSSFTRYSLPKMLSQLWLLLGAVLTAAPSLLALWVSGHPEENHCHLGA